MDRKVAGLVFQKMTTRTATVCGYPRPTHAHAQGIVKKVQFLMSLSEDWKGAHAFLQASSFLVPP